MAESMVQYAVDWPSGWMMPSCVPPLAFFVLLKPQIMETIQQKGSAHGAPQKLTSYALSFSTYSPLQCNE
jgi:hypothetical protein